MSRAGNLALPSSRPQRAGPIRLTRGGQAPPYAHPRRSKVRPSLRSSQTIPAALWRRPIPCPSGREGESLLPLFASAGEGGGIAGGDGAAVPSLPPSPPAPLLPPPPPSSALERPSSSVAVPPIIISSSLIHNASTMATSIQVDADAVAIGAAQSPLLWPLPSPLLPLPPLSISVVAVMFATISTPASS